MERSLSLIRPNACVPDGQTLATHRKDVFAVAIGGYPDSPVRRLFHATQQEIGKALIASGDVLLDEFENGFGLAGNKD